MSLRSVLDCGRRGAGALLLLAFWLAASPLAARDDAVRKPATEADVPAATAADEAKASAEQERSEDLAKPGGGSHRDPEESNPALLNPCHGNPQPKWCGE